MGARGELYVSSSASWYVLPERMTRKMFAGHEHSALMETSRDLLEINRRRAKDIRRALHRGAGEDAGAARKGTHGHAGIAQPGTVREPP